MKECALKIAEAVKKKEYEKFLKLLNGCLEEEKTDVHSIVKTSSIMKLAKLVWKELREFDEEFFFKLWKDSLKDEKDQVFGMKSGRYLRLFVIGVLANSSDEVKKRFTLKVADYINDWETCDQLALKIVAPVAKKDENFLNDIEELLKSENPWKKRLPIATVPPLVRKRPDLSKRLLGFIEKAFKDPRPEVKKACGWALREISKMSPEDAKDFIEKYKDEEDKTVKWVLKDGGKLLKAINNTGYQ